MSQLSQKHLLGIKDITRKDIELIFETAASFKEVINRPIKKYPPYETSRLLIFSSKILPVQNYLLNSPKNGSPLISSIFHHQGVLSKKERPCWIP